MPKPYPREFRDDVVAVARKGEAPLKQIAADFGISESWLEKTYHRRRRQRALGRLTPIEFETIHTTAHAA